MGGKKMNNCCNSYRVGCYYDLRPPCFNPCQHNPFPCCSPLQGCGFDKTLYSLHLLCFLLNSNKYCYRNPCCF